MKTNDRRFNHIAVFLVLLGLICWIVPAQADLKEIKKYKEAFPDSKPKCINCHTEATPKKEDGQHDPNDYGNAVLNEVKDTKETTADTYKKIGPIEDFVKK